MSELFSPSTPHDQSSAVVTDEHRPAVVRELAREEWEGPLVDESAEAYHQRNDARSSSEIKLMLVSPRHYQRLVLEKELLRPKQKSDSLAFGTIGHDCNLEGNLAKYIGYTGDRMDKRTKEYLAFEKLHEGKTILSKGDYSDLCRMVEVFKNNPFAQAFVADENSMIEKGFLYADPATGIKCRFRPDILNLKEGYICDYKTIGTTASPYQFRKASARYYYHLSAAHYVVGANRLWPGAIKHYYFLVQETSEPFAIARYRLSHADLLRSMEMRADILKQIKEHTLSGSWPDWSQDLIELDLPGYAFEKEQIE